MIAIVSPSKSLDFETPINVETSQPRLLENAGRLVEVLRGHTPSEIEQLMNISPKLARLNGERYRNFESNHTADNAKACVFAFRGDVYQGLKAETFDDNDMAFAQKHFRILSGLYGLLRPLDLIQPYRLEMGTRLAFDDFNTLYQYWDRKILNLLINDLEEQGDDVIVNLASREYFKSIDRKDIPATIVDVAFMDKKGRQYKIISFFAKKARGLMSRFIIQHRINTPEGLKQFNYEGYRYNEQASSERKFVFTRGAAS